MYALLKRCWMSIAVIAACSLTVLLLCRFAEGRVADQSGPRSALWGNDAGCTLDHEHAYSKTGYSFIDFFTADGGYVARTHCMTTQEGSTDWPWIWMLIGLNLLVILGYMRIFVFWRRAYLQEEVQDRNKKLMDLAWIFLFCAICGYVSSIVLFVWPAYRLLGFMLIPLAYFTWKFAANLEEFKLSLSAKRLARELNESVHREKKELEERVSIATNDLQVAKENAENANHAKTDFLARMSHEIRTPLTAIIGYSDIALNDNDEQTRERSMQTVKQNSTHLLNLINDILDVSQIDSGAMKYELIPCSLHDLLSDVVEMMEFKANKKQLALRADIEDGLPKTIITDPTRVKQMITNLVGNAIKFTDQGEVCIEVRMPEHADGSDEVFDIEIAVQDTGVGIHDEHLESIFESFTQGRASIKRVYGGTGLGLTISRKIARDLGGDLTVQSTRGVGSLFVCRFQVSRTDSLQTDQDTDKSTQATPIEHLCNHRFLLVEDGNDNQRLIQHNFNKQGLRIDTASDGYQGIEAIQSATERGADYSLILMDISMPNMDGIECTRKLRSDGITTPIVMLTAHTLQTEVDRSFAAGATAYVNKPIDFKALFDLCAEILNEDQKPTSFAA